MFFVVLNLFLLELPIEVSEIAIMTICLGFHAAATCTGTYRVGHS